MSTFRIVLLLFCTLQCLNAEAQKLPELELRIDQHRLTAEVASNAATRTTGLMNRFSLQPDHGMLFVFPEQQPLAFWMKNTFVPLSIAFIDTNGRILNIEDMAPQTESTHPSRGAALYALEMKRGWFGEHGIAAGAEVKGLPKPSIAKD
jgi:uncharacterized membrane protein (UPF0127 family)